MSASFCFAVLLMMYSNEVLARIDSSKSAASFGLNLMPVERDSAGFCSSGFGAQKEAEETPIAMS
jgi:hypothetical protein